MEKAKIERQANLLLDNYGYSFANDNCVDIMDFAQKLGFVVGNAELDGSEDGFIMILNESDEKIIGVNYNRTIEFKRFVIAHELAHFVLHYNGGKTYLHRENKKGKNEEENDADYFAAVLLMPTENFKRDYAKLKQLGLNNNAICLKLASVYKVPLESVSRRIKEVTE